METLLIIVAVVVILLYINSGNKKIIDSLSNIEQETKLLQKKLSELKSQIQSKTEEHTPYSEKEKTAPDTGKAKDWNKFMPPHAQKSETEVIQNLTEKATETISQAEKSKDSEKYAAAEKRNEHSDIINIPATEKEVPEPATVEKKIFETTPVTPISEKEKKDFEKFIGENLLSKIGIATLVLGIAYFVKYAIDQDWINEIGRVAIGILLGGGIIAVAHKLKDTYRTFSSILVGGGISVLYITVTIAFQDYHIFSQTFSFILLILITAFSVFLSVFYDRKELAIFSLLGGFASPLMVSSGTGNYIVLFSYILILNTGMLILAFKKQWKPVSMIAYILTQMFFWSWLVISFKDEYYGALLFLFLFFVQFYLLVLIEHYQQNRKITAFQGFIILSNNLSLFAGSICIFKNYPVDLRGVITIIIAALNAIPMVLLFKDQKADKRLIYLLIAIVLTFVSLAIPIQLNGCAITMFWAAETVLLLWLWQKSGIKVFKYGFTVIEILVFISLLMDWSGFYRNHITILPVILNKPFITGAIITISVWINAWLLKKETGKEFLPGISANLNRVFSFTGIILLFFTLFLELQYQMIRFYEPASFRYVIYGLYSYLFAGILTLICRNKKYWTNTLYCIVLGLSILYILLYNPFVFQVRGDVMYGVLSSWGYFSMHYFTVLAVIYFLIFLLQKRKETSIIDKHSEGLIYWFATIISMIILSIEIDNILLMIFFNGTNQEHLLNISHNILYPIMWGIASFVLMVIGMKRKSRDLRIISLSLFVLIIAKLYLYDIWKMEQTGRIIAFIFLGVLFLLVSFLYQKLKVLLMKEEEEKKDSQEKIDHFH